MNKRSGIASKQKIMKAAMAVFSRKGYAKANVREIARAAGMSVGGVYLYFRTKEDLYRSLVSGGMLEIRRKTEAIAAEAPTASEALSRIFRLHLGLAVEHREFILLHIREHGFSYGVREKRAFFRFQRELFRKVIEKGIKNGEFRRCDAVQIATIFMASLRGAVLSAALDDIVIPAETLSQFMIRGLRIS